MKAAVCREFGSPLCVEEVELGGPESGEVGVRIAACAICHSDLSFIEGAWGGGLPAIYGHEAAGVVEEVGPDVVGIEPGDHVVVTLVRSCGWCSLCQRGQLSLCEEVGYSRLWATSPLRAGDGTVIQQGLRTAALAEHVTVHRSQVVRIPPSLSLETAALIGCGVMTGVGAVINTAQVEAGATVGVIGTGGVGLNAVQGAVLAGARLIVAVDVLESKLAAARSFGATHTLVAVDVLESKLAAARSFGATHTLVAGDGDLAGEVRAITGGAKLDYVFVAAAVASAVEQALSLVAPGGAVVLVGMPPGARVPIEPETIADRGLRILGSKMGASRPELDVPRLVSLYEGGRLKLDELISGRFPLEQVNEAVATAAGGSALRALVLL